MGKKPSGNVANSAPEPRDRAPLLLLGTFADTTWRMFVPAVGFTLLGVWLDGQFGTKPWLMFVGIAVGVLGAWLLVIKQVDEIRGDKK